MLAVEASALRRVVADNIRLCARRRRVSLNALADFAGVSRAQLYDVLAGRKAASTDWLGKIAAALDLEAWELLKPAEPERVRRPAATR
ncbi:MAG: helix-turn-helix transcriptional regulator [Deltaproteobacteria bacterium]|nr:helix-turn-helix transcriptional regulator [Deltaproteobacteria bacterium]